MIHTLKTLPEYWEAQRQGVKRFEIRKNDRGFKVGDDLVLVNTDTGEVLYRHVTYVTGFKDGLKRGYVALGTESRGIMI